MMLNRKQIIYSPEQIAARMREIQEVGLIHKEPQIIVQEVVDDGRIKELEKKLEQVKRTISTRGRKTPGELRAALSDLFETYDFSPAEELVRMVMEKNPEDNNRFRLDPGLRTRILTELQSYVMPKLSATKVEGKVDHQHTVMIVRYGDDGNIRTEKMRDVTPVKLDAVDDERIKEAVIVEKVLMPNKEGKS